MRRWNKSKVKYQVAAEHYDLEYFRDQSRDGDLRGAINAWKFLPYAKGRERILDFGCGDGALLKALNGHYGVEINQHAASVARNRGFEVAPTLDHFSDRSFDLIVSNHCLEHVENPLAQIRSMRRVIREDGLLVIVVPCHRASFAFCENDRDYHLFSWSAANLGNLVKLADFSVIDSRELLHRWPPKWRLLIRYIGFDAFHFCSRIWSRMDRSSSQVICIAKPG